MVDGGWIRDIEYWVQALSGWWPSFLRWRPQEGLMLRCGSHGICILMGFVEFFVWNSKTHQRWFEIFSYL